MLTVYDKAMSKYNKSPAYFDVRTAFGDLFSDTFFDRYYNPFKYEVRTDDGGMNLDVDLPGVKREDLVVTVEKNVLTVHAKRSGKEVKYSWTISDDYDPETVKASLVDGVLTVSFALYAKNARPGVVTVEVK